MQNARNSQLGLRDTYSARVGDDVASSTLIGKIVIYRAAENLNVGPTDTALLLPLAVESSDWSLCESAIVSNGISCLVYVQALLRTDIAVARIARIRGRHPHCAVIVVTERDADTIRLLCPLGVDEIVWSHQTTLELLRAVGRARTRDLLHSVASIVASLPNLPPLLREALLYVATSHEVVSSVKQLATFMRCNRATLCHHWTKTARVNSPMRLEDYLNWVVLMRAVTYKNSGSTWGGVAHRLGLHEQTLSRVLGRLAAEKPSHVTSSSVNRITMLFREQLVVTFS